jgi:CRP-like cAMP-binding protein
MVLSWFGSSKAASLDGLIARKKYAKAVEVLRQQFQQGARDPRLRLQMADVLVLAGRGREAIPIYIGVADEYALEGFAAKGIAVLKKIAKIEPGRADVEQRLAGLIKQKDRQPPSLPGMRPPPVSRPAEEIGLQHLAGFEPSPMPPPPSLAAPAEGSESEPTLDLEVAEDEVLTEEQFAAQLLDAIQTSFAPPGSSAAEASAGPAPPGAERTVPPSPLFDDFSAEELVAVIQGFDLISYQPGDIIISEGEPGDSLFILTTGCVKAFVRNPSGRHVQVRELGEGEFFGEISILSGKPRTATVTAATPCELLELDRARLDAITASHPRVLEVLREFYERRSGSDAEALVRGMAFGGGGTA